MKRQRALLLTGFEPFGGFTRNPSAEIAVKLDGARIGGVAVVGRVLPVDLAALDGALGNILAEIEPVAAVLLGLAAGESAIRLERRAVNLADFPIPDNAGMRLRDRKLVPGAPDALPTRLPLRDIQDALLAAGIPAVLSESAGAYLCNAAMFAALRRLPKRVPCGFIHLPHLPQQVAALVESGAAATPSMEFSRQRRAVELALAVTLESRPPKA